LPGLQYILDHFDQNITILAGMLASVPSFGAKFLNTIDRAMQFFFKAVQNAENVEHLSDHFQSYLYNKATDLMAGIQESRAPIDIVLLECLRTANKHSYVVPVVPDQSGTKRESVPTDESPTIKRSSILNENAKPAWQIPSGKNYAEIFQARSENLRNWPTFNKDGEKETFVYKVPEQKPMHVQLHSLSLSLSLIRT
jgi:hypothetical protein